MASSSTGAEQGARPRTQRKLHVLLKTEVSTLLVESVYEVTRFELTRRDTCGGCHGSSSARSLPCGGATGHNTSRGVGFVSGGDRAASNQ